MVQRNTIRSLTATYQEFESRPQDTVPIVLLLQPFLHQVGKERAGWVMELYAKLRKNEITRERFLHNLKITVGNHMYMKEVLKLQMKVTSASTSVVPGNRAMETCDTPFFKEKSTEELGLPPPPLRKRRKLYETLDAEKGDPLNDVISVSGIDLKEEQGQLFYGPTKNPSPTVAREETEEAIMLQKIPLGKKLEQITSKCGITNMSAEIEHCLSLGVEEIMHRLIRNMMRVSKKRLDFEKTKHEILVTSDIRHQIGLMSQKAQYRGKGGKDQGVEVEGVANKTIQAAAANVAARTAVGGEDLLEKWQLMAQKGSQRQGTSTQPTKEKVYTLSQTSGRSIGHLESQEGTEDARRGDIVEIPQKVVDVVSYKDVIAVLEKEPQVSKSTIYCLHEKFKANATANRLNG